MNEKDVSTPTHLHQKISYIREGPGIVVTLLAKYGQVALFSQLCNPPDPCPFVYVAGDSQTCK